MFKYSAVLFFFMLLSLRAHTMQVNEGAVEDLLDFDSTTQREKELFTGKSKVISIYNFYPDELLGGKQCLQINVSLLDTWGKIKEDIAQ